MYTIPKSWGFSVLENDLIVVLMLYPGEYISPSEMCEWVYGEDIAPKSPAPAKLRVLIQRCRKIVRGVGGSPVEIEIKRGKGWRISRRNVLKLKRYFGKSCE